MYDPADSRIDPPTAKGVAGRSLVPTIQKASRRVAWQTNQRQCNILLRVDFVVFRAAVGIEFRGVVRRLVAQHLASRFDIVVFAVVIRDAVHDFALVVGGDTTIKQMRTVPIRDPHRLAAFVVPWWVGFGQVADPDTDN